MIWFFFAAPTEPISPSSPTQEPSSPKQRITTPPPATFVPLEAEMSSKGKAPAQDIELSMEELQVLSPEHDNLVLSVSDPVYTRRLTGTMNAHKDRRLLEAIGNNLMLSAGLVF